MKIYTISYFQSLIQKRKHKGLLKLTKQVFTAPEKKVFENLNNHLACKLSDSLGKFPQ